MGNKARPPPPPKGKKKPPPPPPKGRKSVSKEAPPPSQPEERTRKKSVVKGSQGKANGHQHHVPVKSVQVHDFGNGESPPDDLIKLNKLEEGFIVGSLRERYNRDVIYTYVGTVLISVNPYHVIDDLYTPSTMDSYASVPQENVHDDLPPHIFAIASGAYHGLMSSWRNQAILISGESGAGKTEACKLVLEYLMEMSARAPKAKEDGPGGASSGAAEEEYGYGLDRLENQCMQAQTIFESFGNAKTVRNNNSSRFGKWIEVLFGNSGHISGAHIKTYLLEKSRLTKVDTGERNYHVFYQMLAYLNSPQGAGDERMSRFKLQKTTWKSFSYLSSSKGGQEGGGHKELAFVDSDNFDKLITSLNIFGLNSEAIDTIMQLLAAILHLGNIKFANKRIQNESSDVQGSVAAPPPPGRRTESPLSNAAELMGVPPEALERAMCYSSVTAGRDVIEKPNTVEESYRSRDALAKGVYEGLFKWIGSHINRVMKLQSQAGDSDVTSNKVIGILDIFGFESLQTNSFEQICINYCNEKLHFHFNEECFRIEQQEYIAEGVSVENVPYIDNAECIDMFEASGKAGSPGIFALIDTEVHAPGGSEVKLLENMYGLLKDKENLTKPHPREGDSRQCFKVIHYAGTVVYNSAGLLEKSRDTIHPDIRKMIKGSSSSLVRDIAEIIGADRSSKTPGKSNKATLGTQFCKQLSSLMGTVNEASPHFVKCMKPNDKSSQKLFMVENVIEQLRCAGILSLCQLRKVGFCERITFSEFVSKYSCLSGKQSNSSKDIEEVIERLSSKSLLHGDGWVKGHTKIMLKTGQHNTLEKALLVVKRKAVAKIEKQVRVSLFRKRFSEAMAVKNNLKAAMGRENLSEIKACMDALEDRLPGIFSSLPVYSKAKNLTQRLNREMEAISLLKKAIDSRHVQTLKSALKTSLELGYKKDAYVEAQALLETIARESALESLQTAMQSKKKADLKKALKQAKSAGLSDDENVKRAELLLQELGKPKAKAKPAEPAATAGKVSSSLLDAMHEVENEGQPKVQDDAEETEEKEAKEASAGDGEADLLTQFGLGADKKEGYGEESEVLADFGMVLSPKGQASGEGEKSAENLGKEFSALGLSRLPSTELWRTVVGVADILSAKLNTNSMIMPKEAAFFRSCVAAAEAETTLSDDQGTQLTEIKELCARVSETSECNENLKNAVYTKNLDKLIDALETVESLGMESPYIEQAKTLQQDLQRQEMEKSSTSAPSESQIIDIAKSSRWRFDKFVKLRSRDDFVRGKWRGRKRLMGLMLQHQRENLPNSLTCQSTSFPNLNRIATSSFKCLLGATGVKKTTFPAGHAHELLKTGLKHEALRDEILIQQIKQIHNNQDPKSTYTGWLLLCIWISLFCPSIEFELHLINFLIFFREHGVYGMYAKYCLAVLQKQFQVEEVELKKIAKKIALPSVDQLSSVLQGKSTPFIKKLD
ncbi:myosin [Chloropicon primus]|uniref:Myosin n=1 Tax=Chloropicon primus TaxID=1764295 RepID=A0A5B8MCW7_9CHLO|nr:myosin [Chloropicon primus]UPQ97609.1 myosin [Chloropicon primus]|eukprot:QDZ18398.1 myosin [Chloropicon primus]